MTLPPKKAPKLPRRTCPVCGREFSVSANGKLRRHLWPGRRYDSYNPPKYCQGSESE